MSKRRDVPLRDLPDCEITTVRWGQADDAPRFTCLRFECPVCHDHSHLIPYRPGSTSHGPDPVGGNVWANPSGSTLDDLTLAPSYLARAPRAVEGKGDVTCRLHVFVRSGTMQILGDSGLS